MPVYKVNGETYNIPDDKIEAFEKRYPNAKVEIYDNDGASYSLPISKRGNFQRKFDKWSYTKPESNASAAQEETPVTSVAAPQTEGMPLTEQDKMRLGASAEQMKRRTQRSMDDFKDRMETMREYRDNAPLGGGQTAEGEMRYNPESGKFVRSYITPVGNRYANKAVADMESRQYRHAADMSVSGQLRRANQKLEELKAKRAEAANRAHERAVKYNEDNLTPLGKLLVGGDIYRGQIQSDPEGNAYDVAIRQTEELIKDLEEQQDREQGIDVGFWRGFGRTMGDFRTWDFGVSDMMDAMTMANADQLKGDDATEGEREAYNEMMGAIHNKEQAEQMYGGNASFWNRAGVMTGYMPSFMIDFIATGVGFKGINVLSKAGAKGAVKVLGKEVVEDLAKQGMISYVKNNGIKGLGQVAANWTIKALGTTADDLLLRAPLMTNTVQAGKTAADIIDRKLGDVVVNEDGTYDFSNDKTWGSAIWQGEANAIIENYSEMFGAHLDPVMTFGNMSKLANVIGAKRLGAVLSKADAGALSGIMGQTHQLFNKMGVSDYFGEVAEEYYGQMWRTMLNLDDAYQQNPDGSRTNLLATWQFYGDIWGGMALSMGLMGAGKHTLTGAQYMSIKHSINKADTHAAELLGKEVWESMRATIDLTTNDDMGAMAEAIINDKGATPEERAAVLTYMERSMMMRGFNLGTLAQKRGAAQNEDVQALDESYIDGYNISSAKEMNDAKNMFDYQRKRVLERLGKDILDDIDDDPQGAIYKLGVDEATNDMVLDYLNAKQVYDGMIQRVRDDIDGRIDQSNAMVDARTNLTTGMIQPATMKNDRRVYVVAGNLVQYTDGSGIDNNASDGSIIVRDAETGALEQVSPEAILNIDEALDPIIERETAAEAIRQQYAQDKANKIDGVVTLNPGDTYTITGDDAQVQVQIVANDGGVVDNGDGTVNVSDGTNIFPLAKETIQQQVDAANMARIQQFEEQRTIENAQMRQAMQEADRPQYAYNDLVSLRDENGTTVRGSITANADDDGRFEVHTEAPINGKLVNMFTRDELDNLLLEHNGVIIEQPDENEGNNGGENIPENNNIVTQNIVSADLSIPAMQRIPKDEQGNPLYEQADSDTAWDAIVEQTEGDEAMAQTVADSMVSDKEAALNKLEKAKSKGGATPAEKIAAEKERKAAIDAAKQELDIWKKIAGTANRRKMEADAERRRIASEEAARLKAEEERLRAEREEAERIEREALNGVPDMVDDTPQDARARGYRRVSGHKIDRQEPVQGLQGKEISVKFSDNTIPTGHVAVIEAEQLQPSHIQGVRNPLHFIDEAQPKERNDEASVLSARKIAGNIRPEEITSSVTAYTGAPTVNARGEAIQGNSRSDALRQMWESHPDQSAKYKQYLTDHAQEFGLNAEDIAGMQHPVLVNMLDVEDADAITLGQYVAQDTESGGTERIKPKNALQRMGADIRTFANLLLKSSDEEISFAGLVDNNGVDVLKWMSQRSFITPTQYKSAFDSKGNITAEAKNDLRGIMYQSVFKGGSTRLEEMFNLMPAKAQKAILATAFRDFDSPSAERMIEEIQDSIRAYYALSQDTAFAQAKTFKDARLAVEAWKIQYAMDDVTGESYLPAENFSNFALLLATMYKGENQSIIQGTFNKLYDLIQGTQEENLFEQPDNTPRTLAQAIKETLNITYNGQRRSNVLVGDSSASQRGQQGSTGNAATGERVEDGERTADSAGSIEGDSRGIRIEQENRGNQGEETHIPQTEEVIGRSLSADEAENFIADMEENADTAPDIELTIENWDALFGEEGTVATPIGEVKMGESQFTKLMRTGRNGKLGMIKPTLENPHAIVEDTSEAKGDNVTERASSYVFIRSFKKADGSRYYYFTSVTVSKDGKEVVISNQEKSKKRISNLLQNGVISWINKNVQSVSEAQSEESVLLDDSQAATQADNNTASLGINSSELSEGKDTTNPPTTNELGEKSAVPSVGEQVQAAEAEVNTNPTDKQKEAGNYKKGHVQVGVFDITIEQPKGSVRSGVDANGNKWKTTMQNTYGYIRGTEGVDGDHIDVFLSDDIDGWNGRRVFVVDQYNEDGSFDEHKVMLGFNETDDAEAAYFANYDSDWANNHKTVVTSVNLEDFEKWIASSHRKTKAFAEYKSVKTTEGHSLPADRISEIKSHIEELHKKQEDLNNRSDIFEESRRIIAEINELFAEQRKLEQETNSPTLSQKSGQVSDAPYSITPAQYTTKKGKVLDMYLVKFAGTLTKEQQRAAKELAKANKGWYDREQGGFMMRSEESAKQLADTILNNDDAVSDAQPVSLADTRNVVQPQQVNVESLIGELNKNGEAKLSDHIEQPANPSGNRLVTDERYAELRERMRKKLGGQMNIGIDPEILAIGTEMAVYHLEKGARKFAEYATAMIADLGDAIRPYLKAFYNGARNLPEVESSQIAADMTPYDEVQQFNVATFGKEHSDPFTTAEIVVAEQAHEQEAEQAKQEIINQRNTERRKEDEQTSADTEAIASQAEAVAGEAERIIEEATTEEEVTEAEQKVDEQLNAIDEQLAKFNIDDLHSGMRAILKDGRNVLLSMVMHSGEQLSAAQFSKPRVHRLYGIHKGQMVDISPADVDVDATRRLLETNDVAPVEVETKQDKSKKSKKKAVSSQQSNELVLFDSLFDNETSNEDGLQRNDEVRSEGVSANSNRNTAGGSRTTNSEEVRQESKRTQRRGESGSQEISGSVQQRNERLSGRLQGITEPKNTRNNHSERGKDHAPTSVDARIEANIKAIELAQQLLESGEQATEKQMQTLRKFSGWGGLGKAFSEGTYYAPNRIAKQLRELLGEEAYQQAVMSANSAYYTPAYVIDTLWDIAEQMGFNGGNILEGSAGIGNILGQMPTHISEQSDIHAIEIDGTSGGILSLLYPDAKVEIQGFEQTRIANGSVDLAITNVPFVTGLRVNDTTGDKDLSKKFHNIHDFCIAKNVRKLREGGLGIFITSNGTLDNSKKLRDWIVSEGGADFVGAFRMHNKTFGGTGVTSDIIVIRKRVNGKKSAHAIDVSTISGERMAEYDTGETRKVKGKETPVIKQLSMDYNRYFIEHPENMAGKMHFAFEKGDTFRPTSKGLYPKQDKNQEQMLADFVQSFSAEEFGSKSDDAGVTDVNPGKKVGEMFVKDGKLYINSTASAQPLEVNANKVKGHTKVECFEAYSAIKEALAAVLEYQNNNEDDKGLKPLLAKLNKAYDDFVATYGHFNKNTAIAFLRNDVDYANVFALEKFEETADARGNKVQKFGKTDIFSKRVIEKEKEPTPTNVKDGIIASIFKFGRIDVPYIAEHLGKSDAEIKAEIIESGYGFEDPATRQLEVSYLYLSGNVREKLRQAEANNENGEYDRNIKALQDVMPMDIPAHLIDFTLGSSWIDPKLYEDYVKDRTEVGVQFTAVGGTWFMNEPYFTNYEKNRAMGVTSEMLGRTVMGHTLIEAAIQNRSITVSTTKKNWDGTTETITDKEATQACAAKIEEIRQDFKEWARQQMQGDPEMSQRIERIYNDTFNNYVPMSIPEDFVPEYFAGAARESDGKPLKMYPHQGRAIVRGTMQPLLLAHEVGTGKTFTLISTAMEMRRLGTARKPMIVVQNSTVGQFVADAKKLYPNAKILTLEEADHSAKGRKNFYAKIRYNDWDMIVVPQSTFDFIPDSEERQMAFVQSKIEEKMLVLEKMKEADPDGSSMITRQAEREIAQFEEQLAELSDESAKKRTAAYEKKRAVALQNAEVKAMEMLDRRTDDVENFDDMGIDALLIDEAHEYKHLGFATAMQRGVKGVDSSDSKKSQGVYLKTQAVLEKNNGRNVILATGTPISNTAAEIWTFMRYLMPADTMKEYGIYYFDDFVRNFGNIQQMLEFTTSGKFKENNRFAGYVNLPELVRIWSSVSDTVLTREAGSVSDKIPEMEGGKAQDIYLPQTRALRSIMKFVKAQLEEYDKMSGKEKKENSHIPLNMYGIAKAAAVDARLVQSDAEDDAHSKTNEAVRQTLRSLKETADYKGTVAIFADNYQNKESGFNLYEDIRAKLIAEGVPADEIVVIKSGMTVKKKLEIFEKVNRGEIRVILGSTVTLGTGVNIQERLHTLIHLDAPNRPMDYTQRNGRILRQGNLHKAMGKPVRVLRFGVEDSLDVTAYQRLKTKGAIADSIMNGKQMMANSMTNRVLEEEEDVFGDTVAQLSGSEYAMLKNNAEKNVRKYASRKKQWEADQTYIHNAKPRIKAFIKDAEKRIEDNSRYLDAVQSAFPDGKFTEIIIGKHRFASVEAMEDFFKEHNKSVLAKMKQMKEGQTAGEQERELTIHIGDFSFVVTTKLTRQTKRDGGTLFNDVERKMHYSCPELGIEDIPVRQNLLRNAIEDITKNVITGRDFAERLESAHRNKKHYNAELEQLLSREGKPFEYEAELEQAKSQYEEYAEKMKKELEEKEAKYAEMDATVEASDNLEMTDEDDDTLYRSDDTMYRIREEAAPINTGIGYKVFVLKNGELYPPMVANPNGEATPVGVWLDADAAPIAGQSKTGRSQVKAGGKGTQGGSGKLAYRPGWHLGEIPYALQFNRNDENGERTLFPANFVWAEVEYANDVDYQEEAMSYGYNQNGKFQHSYAGLPRVPENGAYTYRTNPNPETDPWIITGAMRVKRLLTPTEVDEIVKAAGREPQRRQEGAVTDAEIEALNAEIANDYREGVGTYTDDEVSFESDPWSKVHGKPRGTRKQRREFAERERQRMVKRVESLAKKLHLDNVEIVTDASTLEGKKQRAKGFYSKSTGKITIVIPNHSSAFDVEQSLLHEAVAHYGLRQLFGEHFDTFLDNVFNNASEDVRRRIVKLAAKNGWNFRKATEEYLAMLAENTEFENTSASWWRKIKDFFLNMLHKIGFEDFRGVTLTDNELRYILWRSYENLAEPGRHRSILGEAADVAMQYDLKVGNYAVTDLNPNRAAENDDELYRNGTTLREEYDRKVRVPNKSGSVKWIENLPYRMKESYRDCMAALKTLQDLISEETGNPIQSFENAYMAENRMSSQNKSQAEIYERDFYAPLRKAVQALIKAGSSYEDLKSYIIAKHGLERNEYMRTQAEANGEDSDRDFAGLTALTGMDEVADAEAEAQRMVDEYENDFDVSDLWEKINAATKETLRKSYDSGLMDKSTYEKVRDMYEYYVPLRGWDCEVASNEYEYLTSNKLMLSPALKVAKGRKSLADDPLATIGFMAESSIVQGNRNIMKQKFLNFVLNNPTDLVSVSEQWYVLDNATGEWEARNPVIPDNATGDEVAAIVEQFEQDMEALGDKATKKRAGLKLSMNITKREGQEHVVRVKRNGKEYCIYINGSPRAAQAINGLTNPDVNDRWLYKVAKSIKNWMARMFTSKNPTFIATNLSRDVIWAGTAVAIKEDAAYTARYTKNISECLLKAQLPRLLMKFKNGTLDMNNELERYFDEFIRNGGETGFTQLNTVEDYKRNIKRFVKEAEGKGSITKKAWNGLWDSVEFLNRSAEDTTRFMVYMTSRQMGRDVARSIWDAKEITVNFNKKGSGGLGASVMNFCFIFFNATIQSLSNFGKLLANHPVKTTMALTLFSSAGLLVPMLNLAIQAMLGGDDDDENSYWDLPEWIRRNNIVLYVPWSKNGYITIPLPHEMRPFYGMGEIAYSCLMNKEDVESGLMKAAAGFSALLPIDLTGNGGNIAVNMTPTIGQPFAQIVANTDYFGKPIYKRHEWNERYPEWTKAYKDTAPWLVDGTRWLNELGGGNNVKSGGLLFDWNPALIEHLFESYLGGVGKTINKSQKTLEMLWNEDLREWRNVPVVSSFYRTAEEQTAGSQINREYFNAVDEMEDTQHLYIGYKREVKMGNIEYAEKINELINSEVFKRYSLIKGYSNAINKATNALKLIKDPTKREDVETTIMNLKVEMLEKLEDLEKRK